MLFLIFLFVTIPPVGPAPIVPPLTPPWVTVPPVGPQPIAPIRAPQTSRTLKAR